MSKRILGALTLCALLIVPNQPLLAWQQPATAAPARNAEVLTRTNQLLQEVSQLRHLSVVSPVKSGLKSRKEIEQVVISSCFDAFNERRALTAEDLLHDTVRVRA